MVIPDNCINCEHATVQMEEVHDGRCKFHLDSVVRCDRFPAKYKVGCVCAEVHCEKKGSTWTQR